MKVDNEGGVDVSEGRIHEALAYEENEGRAGD
jgi:hypothetical protein